MLDAFVMHVFNTLCIHNGDMLVKDMHAASVKREMQIGTVVTRMHYLFSMDLLRQKGTPHTHTFPCYMLTLVLMQM